jgi:hypothetical protein
LPIDDSRLTNNKNNLKMKNTLSLKILTPILISIIASCSKEKAPLSTASLTLINAVPGSTPSLVTNFGGGGSITWYNNALKLVYGTANNLNQTGSYSGEQKLTVYRFPDTLVQSKPLFNLTLHLKPAAIYTLFLTGTLTSPDTLFTTDAPPFHPPTDSTLGIRFVNLSPGSTPVSVNIAGNANGSEVSSLPYKGITAYKNYPATAAISMYKFEFRDAATGTVVNTLDVTGINAASNAKRFRNYTVALMGIPGDAATKKILLIDAYWSN